MSNSVVSSSSDIFHPVCVMEMEMEESDRPCGGSPSSNYEKILVDGILGMSITAEAPPTPPNSDRVTTIASPYSDRATTIASPNSVSVTTIASPYSDSDTTTASPYSVSDTTTASPNSDVRDFAANNNGSYSTMDFSGVPVKTLHISTSTMAIKTPSFKKLLSNRYKRITLWIRKSDEPVLLELLNVMCSNNEFSLTQASFSRTRELCRILLNSPMTLDSALFYIELPHTIQMAYAIQPLIDAAKQYLVSRYKDLTKCMQQEEVMALPLSGIEAILASDDLHVESEDVVYDFVLNWATQHYTKPSKRRQVLTTRLAPLIRFPHMTSPKLKEVLVCDDFTYNVARELVIEALLFKEQPPASLEANHRRFVERAYKLRPVTVLHVQLPWQQHHYVVRFNLTREECANLFPSGQLYSHPFHLGVHAFFLKAECNMDQQGSFHCFGLFLGMPENAYSAGSSLAVDYEFTARSRPPEPIANEFLSKYKGNCTFTEGTVVGHKNMFAMPWNSFIAQDSLLFMDDVLHLKVRLTIKT